MLCRHMLVALALGAAAVLAAACGDAVAPPASVAPAPQRLSNGRKLGQCFLQIGLSGTQVAPDAGGNATVEAPAGEVVTRVAIKAGTACWFTPEGVSGTYTFSFDGAPCYVVAGLASAAATVARVGDGPGCKDISHVEFVSGAPPPTTGFLQICAAVSGDAPPEVPPEVVIAPLTFAIAGQQIAVAAGLCSAPIELPGGEVVITELQRPSSLMLLTAATAPADRLVAFDVGARTATVTVVAGSTTVVTITDLWAHGQD